VARQDGSFNLPAIPLERLPLEYRRQTVDYPTAEAPGTIIINPSQRVLYLITGKNQAIRYGIAVGKDGFEWSGEAVISERKFWPTWTPPKEMIARKPELAKWEKGQPGGPENPLGARALYLTSGGRDYGYRIHGTPEWWSIGRNASSGCIRMVNQDVMDLFERVPVGTKVIVLTRDGKLPTGLYIPAPPTVKNASVKKKPVAPTPTPTPTPIIVPPPVVMPAPVITGPATPTPAVLPTPVVPATEGDI
jgi:lipoprotein-anchoring transpeptidase ErfK/SrfK